MQRESEKSQRPIFFNLTQIKMPVGAWTSIGHRMSGLCLTLSLPFAIYLLHLSLQDAHGYERVSILLRIPVVRIGIVILTWAVAHHLFAGIRHILSDMDIGSHLPVARRSAWATNISALGVAILTCAIWL